MDINQKCTELITFLSSSTKLVKDFIEKTRRIDSFCQNLSNQDMREINFFKKSPYVTDIIQAVLNMCTQITKFKSKNFDAIYNFFSILAKNNIPLSKEEKDTQELVKLMIDIITQNVPNADDECWIFWLNIFTEIFKIPTFYSLFREKFDEDDSLYIKQDSLFSLIRSLMKFDKIINEDSYSKQRSLALNLFWIFLDETPFKPTTELIDSIFSMTDSLSIIELSDRDFNNLLKILNELIILSPTTFLIDLSSPFQTPFNENLLSHICEKWNDISTVFSLRKSSSLYLLLFLTTIESLNYDLPQNFVDDWVKKILDFWLQQANKGKIFESSQFIPYLRADIEFLKRSRDSSISKCLLQYILSNNNKIKSNSNIIWLFTAIGLYKPEIIDQEDWLQILKAASNFDVKDAVWHNQQAILDFYGLISVMVNVVDSKSQWNNVFEFLIKKQHSNDQFYLLLSKILAEQKIDTKVAHRNESLLWNDLSSTRNYSLERLRCIHILIYYYGFENHETRIDCFNVMISLLYSEESLSKDYLYQLSLTICSIISSYPLPFIKPKQEENKENIDDVLINFTQQIQSNNNKNKIETPLQTEDLYFITSESSQISVEEGPESETDSFSESPSQYNDFPVNEKNENEQPQFPLCNFISRKMQFSSFVKNILTENIKDESNQCFFRLFMTSKMPNFFSPASFLECFERDFKEKGNDENFPSFCETLLAIIDEFANEDFHPFFENIEEQFFEIAQKYIQLCESRIQNFLKENSPISWDILDVDEFNDVLLFAEFSVKCSQLAVGTSNNFFNCFEGFLSTTVEMPILHLQICSHLLNLTLSEMQKARIIESLEDVVNKVLHVYLVPVKDRDDFLISLFNTLKYDYNVNLENLFKCIFKYSVTPMMKLSLLYIMKYNYVKCSQIFDVLFESGIYSPYFIDDDYLMVRLSSIETIISILKLKKIMKFDGYVLSSEKFDKVEFFNERIVPCIESIFESENDCKQKIFTSVKTLIQIASEIPELTTKSLYIILRAFTLHDYTIFSNQCINFLFSGLSNRSHFSLFLRQFIPLLIPQLEKLTEKLSSYPFELFYFDHSSITINEAKKMFCEKAGPYAIAYSIVNSKQEMIDFFSSSLNKPEKEIIQENSFYVAAFLLISINEGSSLEDFDEQLIHDNKFVSPIPLLSFISMASEESIELTYEKILEEENYEFDFLDIRNTIFLLYSNIYKAKHELIQSHYLQQFSLYVSILFKKHKEVFEEKETLYSDILALTVNMLQFVPTIKSLELLLDISSNIPVNFNLKMVGFVKNIEDICIFLGFHPCLDNFFERFPKLINKILIFDFLKERQLKERTPLKEFKRIAKTKRLNQESINFLLTSFIEDSDSIESINNLSNNMKRTVLNEVYNFAILNPQTLALHLYSEMFLNFINIHPSPLIIDSNLNSPIILFTSLIELARDKNPSISRSALTALHILVTKSKIPKIVMDDSSLKMQLEQYKEFSHLRKNPKRPNENSPWICKYVCSYIDQMDEDQVCHAFGSIAAVSSEFCQKMFPHLFAECLDCPLFDSIYYDFNRFAENTTKYSDECKLFISAFNYLRAVIFKSHAGDWKNWHLNWHKRTFDFQKIMEVCLKIGDPYSAYQFAEFAREATNMSDEPLNRIFTDIGVNDLKYGLNYDFSDPLSVAELHSQDGRLRESLIMYDNGNNVKKMADTLLNLHLYNLLNSLDIPQKQKNIECLWRLRKWDVSSEIVRDMDPKSHSSNLFTVMQSFATNNEEAIKNKLNDFANQFDFDLNPNVFNQLSYLLDASSLDLFHAVSFKNSSKLNKFFPQTIIQMYRHSLKKLEKLSHQNFNITESANALNGVFFCILGDLNNKSSISLTSIPSKFFSDVISNSLENNEIEAAQYFISLLRENQKKVPQLANFEQIRVLYASNPHHAVSLLEKNIDQILLKKDQLNDESRTNAFNLRVEFTRASWCAHTNNLLSGQIYNQLENVIEKFEQNNLVDLLADAEFTLARVYQRQQNEIKDYLLSSEYRTIIGIIKSEKEQLDSRLLPVDVLKKMKTDYYNYMAIVKRYKELYSTTIIKSIENYMKALKHTSKYDLESTFSIIGIWFDYTYAKYTTFVQEIPGLIQSMKEKFEEIDPIKFLPLFYQLAARVDNMNEISTSQNSDYTAEFQTFLRQIVASICEKSPNECFPVLFALSKNDSQSNKILAICDLIESIALSSEELSDNWEQMKCLLEGYLRLTEQKSDIFNCTTEKMPFLSIITLTKKVGIQKFEKNITKLGGNSHPMFLQLTGTDGHLYSQIVKSDKDDLRQDAVMQQLFVLSAKLLCKKNPSLSIRFYKVVPITPKTGVIQFVEGSISFENYLYKKENSVRKGAYLKYYVNGESIPIKQMISEFRIKSEEYHMHGKERSKIIEYFKKIRSEKKNVFHFFFIEKFPNTADWFVSRLRYSRHTATNSMIGHIFGIGDRHLNNIMIDEKTGEVVHIDLGIAFDQGKALPVPEIVPFRLTGEIIDGMGWMGEEGIFRKTCQESMAVLRNNAEYLLTVLKVFLSDPLYTWISVPKRKNIHDSIQSNVEDKDNNKNKFAESVIVTCQRKLEGRETGEILSVEGQVSKLINDATSDENLAMMYYGWKPYF